MEDLTGFWRFSEESHLKSKAGEIRLFQNGNTLEGYLFFKEWDNLKNHRMIRCLITGMITRDRVVLYDKQPIVLLGAADDIYLPLSREGKINEQGLIVGRVIQPDNAGDEFIMEKVL